eukprot:NODE_8644_length_374_cov_0.689655.p4 GENE.NODE_8644_length_374_cov_0.689655~~NODE_8644_length_374_cov_0.689655.p4  ORF type:complete len:63 (+),score=5.13 NODE_8644_length_374_cov_0.689655:112-300(+)
MPYTRVTWPLSIEDGHVAECTLRRFGSRMSTSPNVLFRASGRLSLSSSMRSRYPRPKKDSVW